MKILLLGKNGQVGWELHRSLIPLGEITALGRSQCDLSKPGTIDAVVRTVKPDVIVNAAAYTAVDRAEAEEELATTINGTSVGVLADEAYRLKSLLVHYSTDYVFDGTKAGPYTNMDRPDPINAYGRSKLAGEHAIVQAGCDYLILRTSWVYSARGSNFLKTVLRLAREREELSIVADQYGAPTWARNIADVTAHVAAAAEISCRTGGFTSGVYHLCSTGSTTWHGFCEEIVERARRRDTRGDIVIRAVKPINSADYPTPAARPENSHLDTSLLLQTFGVAMPDWKNALGLCMDELGHA